MKKDFIKYIFFLMIISFQHPTFASDYGEISLFKSFLNLLFYLGIFIIVIFVTLHGTKLIARNYRGYTNSRYINLLDTLNIPGGTKIIMLEINKKIYILSITTNNTELVDIIDQNQFADGNFNDYLNKYTNKNHNKVNFDISQIVKKINFSKDREDKNEKKY